MSHAIDNFCAIVYKTNIVPFQIEWNAKYIFYQVSIRWLQEFLIRDSYYSFIILQICPVKIYSLKWRK